MPENNEYDPFGTPSGFLEWLSKTPSKKQPKLSKKSNPSIRKYNYETTYTDIRSLENFLFKWEHTFPEYLYDWSLNVEFNFFIELLLNFDLVLDLDWGLDYWQYFDNLGFFYELMLPAKFGLTKYGHSCFDFGSGRKAIFGSSKYGRSYIDPPEITPEDLIRFSLEFRNKYLDKIAYDYRFRRKAMKELVDTHKDIFVAHDVSEDFIKYLNKIILRAEACVKYNSFVNFAVVDYSIVMHEVSGSTGVAYTAIRSDETYEPEYIVELISPTDTLVDFAHVDFSRVSIPREVLYSIFGAKANEQSIPENIAKKFIENVEIGQLHLGTAKLNLYGRNISYLPARHRYYIHGEKIAKKGGVHQAVMQNYINKVKQILDQEGIAGVERLNYISFANEVLYLRHEGVRKNKTWKKNIDIDALVEKYINLGANEDILWKVVKICQRE